MAEKPAERQAGRSRAAVTIVDTTPEPRPETAEAVVPFSVAELVSQDNAMPPELQKYRGLSVVGIRLLDRRNKEFRIGGEKSALKKFLTAQGLDEGKS